MSVVLKCFWGHSHCGNILLFVNKGVDQLLLDSVMMPTDNSPVSVQTAFCLVYCTSILHIALSELQRQLNCKFLLREYATLIFATM